MNGKFFAIGSCLVWGLASVGGAASSDRTIAGLWRFDQDIKGVAKDESPYGNDGEILGNVKWTSAGKFGGALEFGGNTSWVSVKDHESLQFKRGQDFTLAAWLKTEMSAGDPPMVVAKNYQPAQTLPWYALYYANGAKALDGSMSFFLRDSAGTSHHISGGPKIADGKWHHVAGVREKGTIRLYVDGERVAEKGDADFDVGTNPAPLHMMSHLNRWLVGTLDEVILLRRALSDAEMKTLMQKGTEGYLAVSVTGKLSTQWGALKNLR